MVSDYMRTAQAHMQGHCRIEWDGLDAQAWDSHFKGIRRANLLQSRAYGEAAARLYGQKLRRGLVYRDEHLAGLVQIQEAGVLRNAVHAVILDRGPLWFNGFGSEEDFRAFLVAFHHEFPRRFGRRVRLIPEIRDSFSVQEIMRETGYKCKSQSGYQTIWMDLQKPLEDIREGSKKNWRGALRKAEKEGLHIQWDDEGALFPMVLKLYSEDKARKGYDGPSPKLLQALAGTFLRGKNMLIGCAALDGQPIACIVILRHGSAATYQVGWVSEKGREKQAGYVLLWDALRVLKERDVNDFDLGGVNDGSARGVKSFKSGTGGELVEIPGLYV